MRKFLIMTVIMGLFSFLLGTMSVNAEQVYTWETKANIPTIVSGSGAAVVNGNVYLYGGNAGPSGTSSDTKNANMYVYDPLSDSWITSSAMPSPRAGTATAVYDNKIYSIGGYYTANAVSTKTVQVYDTISGIWSAGTNSLMERSWSGAATINNKIYVFGGAKDTTALKHVEVFDPSTQVWTRLNDLPTVSYETKVIQYNGRNFVINLKDRVIWEYDVTTDSYTTITNIPRNRSSSEPALLNGKIYLVGSEASVVDVYNIESNTWSSDIPYPNPKYLGNVVSVNNHIYVIGGRTTASGGNSKEVKMLIESTINSNNNYAILTIHLSNGQIKEYDLTAEQLSAFENWYDNCANGIGSPRYGFAKTWNKGPFSTRTEYVLFGQIVNYDVDEYELDK